MKSVVHTVTESILGTFDFSLRFWHKNAITIVRPFLDMFQGFYLFGQKMAFATVCSSDSSAYLMLN